MATKQLPRERWTKDGRKWIFYDWIPTLDGKRKKFISQAYHTKKEALEAERDYLLSYNKNININDMTFKDLYTQYYEYQEDKVKKTTLTTYKDRIRYMKLLDNIKIKNLCYMHYELWRKEINKLDIKTSYKNDIQKFIKIVLNWGMKKFGLYEMGINTFYIQMTNFVDPNDIDEEMQFYTYEEFLQFINCEEDINFICLFEMLYYCGLRKGEMRALTWNDIDFENKLVRINKNCVTIGGEGSKKYNITTPKTKKSIRTLPVPDILINHLKLLLDEKKKYYGFNNKWFVFGTDEPITNSKTRNRKVKIANLAGLHQIRIHDFRHSCASLLINNGANITVVAEYLGHSKIDETLNTYSHMYKSKLLDVVNTINEITNKTQITFA